MNKSSLITILAVFGLVAVRIVGSNIFYDPLIEFFHHGDYQLNDLPPIVYWKFTFSLFIRFIINSALTLVIVKSVFDNVGLLKLTAVILGLTFIIFTPILLALTVNGNSEYYQYLFYVRRILIHPVLTLILIPAYLYHQRSLKKTSND
ncbi:MAG: exosortase F system-associated membrane protein [Salibacteraceae bacterium]